MEEQQMLAALSEKKQLEKIMKSNEKVSKFGITITQEEAMVLLKDRRETLREKQRVEFGEGILPKLLEAFCDSSYIYQENFLEIMGGLQDIFYEYKNESLDNLSDDELIDFMRTAFEGECQGSLDYLEATLLEGFAREIRVQGKKFLEDYYKLRDIEVEDE